ncbi:hypothetical protein M9H77_06324 [Catharanthus roseus]|uniref:Uncharacterized protein n=1 Tax=Catharanthus roseus TaxID=4058 RepID=A0ACC0BRX2_CATRO|nr:hypothetical protein M9H77_06324 [Catharanthus roseus]
MRRLAKWVLSPSLKDGRRRIQQKETSHIGSTCQLLIERYKSQVDLVLVLVLALDLGRGPVRVLGKDLVGEGDRHEFLWKGPNGATVAENVIGDRNCGYRVVRDFVFGDEHQWPELQLNDDGCPIPPLHVQWIHHRTERVSNWADSYQNRITNWNARVARNRK